MYNVKQLIFKSEKLFVISPNNSNLRVVGNFKADFKPNEGQNKSRGSMCFEI